MPTPNDEQHEALRALSRVSRVLERASTELSLPHYRVLSAIYAGDERASRLAVRLALGKPTVSAAVDSLTERGLLSRSTVAGDQRGTTLRLTAKGRSLLAEHEAALLVRLAEVWDRVPRRDQLIGALVELGAALDQVAEERLVATQSGRF